MFKKDQDVHERSRSLLKNKEIRSLKADIVQQLHGSIDPEDLNRVITNKSSVTVIKLSNKNLLYAVDDAVMFFTLDSFHRANICQPAKTGSNQTSAKASNANSKSTAGTSKVTGSSGDKDNKLFPTIAFLSHFPDCMKTFIIYSPVSEYLMKGADLMMPGLCCSKLLDKTNRLDELAIGEPVCIKVVGNPLPFAVGVSLINRTTLASMRNDDGSIKKGKAVEVLHLYGDLITAKGMVPNSGFGSSCIYAIDGKTLKEQQEEQTEEEEQEEEEEADDDNDDDDAKDIGRTDSALDYDGAVDDMNSGDTAEGGLLSDQLEACKDEVLDTTDPSADESELVADIHILAVDADDPADPSSTTAQHDEALLRAVLLGTKYVLKSPQLPMLVSTYWTLLQRCLLHDEEHSSSSIGTDSKGGFRADIRKSSYRKVSTFLEHCSAEWNLLSLKEENGVSAVVALNKTHDLLRGVKVTNPDLFKERVLSQSKGDTSVAGQSVDRQPGRCRLKVMELFKFSKPMRDIFGNVRGQYGEYLTSAESICYDEDNSVLLCTNTLLQQARDVMTMYLKSRDFSKEAAVDPSHIAVPSTDPIYKVLLQSSTSSSSSSSSSSVASKDKKNTDGDCKVREEGQNHNDDRDSANHSVDDSKLLDDDSFPVSVGSLHSVKGGDPWGKAYQLHIHKDGLIPIEDTVPSAAAVHLTTSTLDRQSNGPSQTVATVSKVSGGSSIGGWGVDAGTVWKPISLPPSSSSSSASTSRQQKKGSSSQKKSNSSDCKGNTAHSTAAVADDDDDNNTPTKMTTMADLVIRKEDFFKSVLKKMSPYFAIIGPKGSLAVHSGALPKVKVSVEARMGSKMITVVRGLAVFGIDITNLVKDCQKKFACSVTLSTIPGMQQKDKELLLQGNLGHDVEAYLVEHCGVPSQLVEVAATKGVKLKRK